MISDAKQAARATAASQRLMATSNPSPTELRDYAIARSWILMVTARADLYLFSHTEPPLRQIMFPVDEADPSYSVAVQDALVRLAEVEQRSVAEVQADVLRGAL